MAGKPIHIMAKSFPVFPILWFLAAIGLPLLTDSGSPMEVDKLKTIFWNLKDEVPLNLKKYPAAKQYSDIYQVGLLLTHLSFRWTVPSRAEYGGGDSNVL